MIHTYYSNAFEVLREILRTNLEWDARARQAEGGSTAIFTEDRVLVPSMAVKDRLMQSFAEAHGICAGVRFFTTNEFFDELKWYPAALRLSGRVLDWVVWRWLCREEFVSRHPRLNGFLKGKNGAERFELALRVSRLFTKYASYRLDWLLRWTKETALSTAVFPEATPLAVREEDRALEAHPDIVWQRDLWREIVREATEAEEGDTGLGGWRRALQFQHVERVLKAIPEGENLHVFLPFTVPPLMLPFLKEIGKRGTVRLYLMQPANGFWFDYATEGGSPALEYLRRNAASTRATLDRLWRFTTDVPPPAEDLPDAKGTVETFRSGRAFSFLHDRLQDLRMDEEAASESFYLRFTNEERSTFLSRAQDALLSFDDPDAVERPALTKDDTSLRFVEAPTPVREAESLVDYLTELFAREPDLKPSDVLVTTPDIAAFAPILEGVLTALPPERRLPFRLVGKPLTMENAAASAFLQLLDLLSELTTLEAFESWLEIPLVGESLGLHFADLSILREWVNDAGFREGLSEAHLEAEKARLSAALGKEYGANELRGALDGTLSRALERLSVGFLLDRSPLLDWAGTIPVRRARAHYEEVASRPDLFTTLLTLYDRLEAARVRRCDVEAKNPDAAAWVGFAEELVNDFFSRADVAQARDELKEVLGRIRIDMEEGLGVGAPVDYRAFRAALGAQFGEPLTGAVPRDAITVADMNAFRGLPYRVIACLGLSENSSFPGITHFEEFDLMALSTMTDRGERRPLRRAGDRDSREDNRNVFTDLFRSARSHFYVSWTIGVESAQPMLPSVVVEELERFLLTLLPDDASADALRVRLPLTSEAEENFRPEGLRFWVSRDERLCEAVKEARRTGRRAPIEPFTGNAKLMPPSDGVVRWEECLRFWNDPAGWLAKRVGLEEKAFESSEETGVEPSDSRLDVVSRSRLIGQLLEKGADTERITKLLAENPINGDPGLRSWWFAEEIKQAKVVEEAWRKLLANRVEKRMTVTLPVGGKSITQITGNLSYWVTSDGRDPACLVRVDSKRLLDNALWTHVLLSAAGMEMPLRIVEETGEVKGYEPMPRGEAQLLLDGLVELFDRTFDAPATWPSPYSGDLLWRGHNLEAARQYRKKAVSAFETLATERLEILDTSVEKEREKEPLSEQSDHTAVRTRKTSKKESTKKATPEEKRALEQEKWTETVRALLEHDY